MTQVPSLMSAVILNDKVGCKMEIDTAAAHCVISFNLFKNIAAKSPEPLVLEQGSVIMRMADGTPSKAVKGMTSIRISRFDDPSKTGIFPVIVVDGPYALLGRPALSKLWPNLFSSWVTSAKRSLVVGQSFKKSRNVVARAETDDVTTTQGGWSEAASAARAHAPLVTSSNASNTPIAATTPISTTTPAAVINAAPGLTATTHNLLTHPTGNISQEDGAVHCKKIAFEIFGDVFDGTQGTFKGVKAEVYIKPDHERFLRVMPPSKLPRAFTDGTLNEEYEKK